MKKAGSDTRMKGTSLTLRPWLKLLLLERFDVQIRILEFFDA